MIDYMQEESGKYPVSAENEKNRMRIPDLRGIVSDSFRFTRETFLGSRTRWLILVLLCLPVQLTPLFPKQDPAWQSFFASATFPDLAGLIIIPCVFWPLQRMFISGYNVRIYRGADHPPGFENFFGLIKDGLRIWLIELVWSAPIITATVLMLAVAYTSGIIGNQGAINLNLVIVTLVIACITALLYALFLIFINLGYFLYARTGTIREGWNFRKILALMGRIGWGNYLLAAMVYIAIIGVVVLAAIILVLGFWFMMLLGGIPLATIMADTPVFVHLLSAIITPVIFIFGARLFTRIYETGIDDTGGT